MWSNFKLNNNRIWSNFKLNNNRIWSNFAKMQLNTQCKHNNQSYKELIISSQLSGKRSHSEKNTYVFSLPYNFLTLKRPKMFVWTKYKRGSIILVVFYSWWSYKMQIMIVTASSNIAYIPKVSLQITFDCTCTGKNDRSRFSVKVSSFKNRNWDEESDTRR